MSPERIEQLHAECVRAVARHRALVPMTDEAAEIMVAHVQAIVLAWEQEEAGLLAMAESILRKQRETQQMTDAEAATQVDKIMRLLRRKPRPDL